MARPHDVDQVVTAWRPRLAAGQPIRIEQDPWRAGRYLLLAVLMTLVCLLALVTGDRLGRLGDVAAIAGIVLFGVLGIPVLLHHVVRGKHPVVEITPDLLTVGEESVRHTDITTLRAHDGIFGPVDGERSGGVSVLAGERHLEIPLPPSVPTGAVVRVLHERAPQAQVRS